MVVINFLGDIMKKNLELTCDIEEKITVKKSVKKELSKIGGNAEKGGLIIDALTKKESYKKEDENGEIWLFEVKEIWIKEVYDNKNYKYDKTAFYISGYEILSTEHGLIGSVDSIVELKVIFENEEQISLKFSGCIDNDTSGYGKIFVL